MNVIFKKDEYVLLDDTNKIIANYIVTKGAKGDTGAGEDNIIEDVKVNNNSLPVTSKSVNIDLTGYVEKETGKGLSTNDYTTTEKNKLAGIEASADVNIIENIKVNGVAQTITNKAVDISVPINTSDLNNDSDFVTSNDLSPVATSGSYTDLSDKPTEQLVNVGTEVDEDYRVNFIKNQKNLLNLSIENYSIKADGTYLVNTDRLCFNYIPIEEKTAIIFSCNTTTPFLGIAFYDENKTYISRIANNDQSSVSGTTPANTKYVRPFTSVNSGIATLNSIYQYEMQLELGSTRTTYEEVKQYQILVDNEEIYSKQVVLWTNPSPSSTFARQTITLSDSIVNYNYYEVIFRITNTLNVCLSTGKVPTTSQLYLQKLSNKMSRRFGELPSGTSLLFGDCEEIPTYGGNVDINNNSCVPVQIIGYK